MGRKIILMILCTMLGFVFVACGYNRDNERNTTDISEAKESDFILDMIKGLEARWEVPDNSEGIDIDVDKSEQRVQVELDNIEKYKLAKFSDKDFQTLAMDYLDAVLIQKEAILHAKSGDYTKYDELWGKGYKKRSLIIYQLFENYNLKVSDKYNDSIQELISVGEIQLKTEENKKEIEEWLKTIKFSKGDKDYTYQAITQNPTNITFSYINLNINLIDKDGIVINSTYSSINNIDPNSKIRFEFYNDKDFVQTDATADYQIADSENYITEKVRGIINDVDSPTIMDTLSDEEKERYDIAIMGYNKIYDNLKNPSSLTIYGVKYNENKKMVIFKYTASNSFGGEVTEYAAYSSSGIIDTEYGSSYWQSNNAIDMDWNKILEYSNSK